MLFSWFDAREAIAFGSSAADFLAERLVPEKLDRQGSAAKVAKKQQDALVKLHAQVKTFKAGHALNIYKKAKLANTFKWRLLEKGFPEASADRITKELLLLL